VVGQVWAPGAVPVEALALPESHRVILPHAGARSWRRSTVEDVNRSELTGVGVLLVVVGVVWFLQGIDVLGGSGMSGKTLWAVIGPIVAVVGVVLVAGSRRARSGRG
jgi:hypothetical protein